MKTTIILLNWNSQEMTEECVRSLLAMKCEGDSFDIIIVDNGSKDGSPQFLQATFPGVEVIFNPRNLGFTGGCNVGMKRALERGAGCVLLVNNDTIVNQDFLVNLLAESRTNPRAAIISPKIFYFDHPKRIWWAGGSFSLWQGVPRHLGWKEIESGRYETARDIDWATGCGMLIQSAALEEVGLFDERIFANGEDLDLSLRMRNLGWRIRYAPTAQMWHKEGFATRKNVGEHARKFTATRNILWVMHKHARAWHWITFWPYFLVRYVSVIVIKSILRGDWRSAWAMFAGIFAFFRMRLDPQSSPLPGGLSQPGIGAVKNPGHSA